MDEIKAHPFDDKPVNASIYDANLSGEVSDNAVAEAEKLAPGQIPEEAKGWCWGAFLLTWIWGIGNRTWIAFLPLVFVFIPKVGQWLALGMAIILLVKGREWAWKNKEWKSIAHFNHVQANWAFAGVIVVLAIFFILFFAMLYLYFY